MAEGLLDDDATPFSALTLVEAGVRQVLGDDGEVGRRNRQVERVVAAGAAHAVQLCDGVGESAVCLRVIEGARDEAQARAQLVPRAFVEAGAGVGLDGRAHVLLEVLGAPVSAREAGQGERGVQQTAVAKS